MPNQVLPSIPGFKQPPPVVSQLRREVANLLNRDTLSFPGAQPVSFARKHIQERLETEDYFVCEKSDGIRCLLYLTTAEGAETCYLIDRKNDYYLVPELHFPTEKSEQDFHSDCLVDGELVLDIEDSTGDGNVVEDGSSSIGEKNTVMRFLVFDALVIDGKLLTDRSLDKRLGHFRQFVYLPYSNLCQKYPDEVRRLFPFLIGFKDMEFSYSLPKLWHDVIPHLRHGTDGLIFTSRFRPYVFGTDENILKWKPADENSVDFRLSLEFPLYTDPENSNDTYPDYDSQPDAKLFECVSSSQYEYFSDLYLTPQEWSDLKSLEEPLNGRIVECSFDINLKKWRYMRFRDDKPSANHKSVVQKVFESVLDNVTKEDLLKASAEIRDAWKKREAKERERRQKEKEKWARERGHDVAKYDDSAAPGSKRKIS
ncbi:mRNA capping enzyme, catalytic domain-containing protein [Lipomyces oligophaga]|uniref:mRNA capping enzyme, catalytic domain-containing protein n=1 Tax=Lipomyces oligophaga TaxID=45792 RepID=UPI0034CDC6B2